MAGGPPAKDELRARVAAVNSAYMGVWHDFLRNRLAQAEERAVALLQIVDSVPEAQKDADLWVTEADFSYIVAAARGNEPGLLQRALGCYDKSLCKEDSPNARRMRAETLLRMRRYEDAFAAFTDIGSRYLPVWEEVEAAPFRLRHDADLCERLRRLGRLPEGTAEEAAAALRRAADRIQARGPKGRTAGGGQLWPSVGELPADDVADLRKGLLCQLQRVAAPYPADRLAAWAPRTQDCGADPLGVDPLGAQVDWDRVRSEYFGEKVTVVDGFFSPEALAELWDFARETTCFRTQRTGYLGAFPGDGNTHPLIISAARSLERHFPEALGGHPLGLWWFFKYSSEGKQGIAIHADAAAVNVNIWITPDSARKSGGGLDVYMQRPPAEAGISEYNHAFATDADEARMRQALIAAGGVRRVDYKQNRAVIFVSDLFHESQPFEFVDDAEQPRVNLTLLFGDRAADVGAAPADGAGDAGTSAKRPREEESGWDLFD